MRFFRNRVKYRLKPVYYSTSGGLRLEYIIQKKTFLFGFIPLWWRTPSEFKEAGWDEWVPIKYSRVEAKKALMKHILENATIQQHKKSGEIFNG